MTTQCIQDQASRIYHQEAEKLYNIKNRYFEIQNVVNEMLFSELDSQTCKGLRQHIMDYYCNGLHHLKQILLQTKGDKSDVKFRCLRRLNFILSKIYHQEPPLIELFMSKSSSQHFYIVNSVFYIKLTFDELVEYIEEELLGNICCKAFQKPNLEKYVYELISFFDSGRAERVSKSLSYLSVAVSLPKLFALSLADHKPYFYWERYNPTVPTTSSRTTSKYYGLYKDYHFQVTLHGIKGTGESLNIALLEEHFNRKDVYRRLEFIVSFLGGNNSKALDDPFKNIPSLVIPHSGADMLCFLAKWYL